MKIYLVFAGKIYYAKGGIEDFKKDFDDLEEAIDYVNERHLKEVHFEWWHIYNTATNNIACQSEFYAHS